MGLQEYIEPIAKVAEVAGKEYSIEHVRFVIFPVFQTRVISHSISRMPKFVLSLTYGRFVLNSS